MDHPSVTFEAALLRRAFIGVASVLSVLLAGTVAAQLSTADNQPAFWPVLLLRLVELTVLTGALVWALADKALPSWVPPAVLALNCILALLIVTGSGGHRELSIAVYLVDGTQFLLAFGFFLRHQWITVLGGVGLLVGAAVLFLVLPRATFPQVLSPEAAEAGFLFLLFFGLAMVTAFVAVNNYVAHKVTARANAVAEQLRAVAYLDPATGLPNGLQLEQDMKEWEAQNAQAQPRPFTLLGFRLDGLEELNENLGVEETTKVVAEVAEEYARELKEVSTRRQGTSRPANFRDLYRVESNLFFFALSLPPGLLPTSGGQGALATVIERVSARRSLGSGLDFQGGITFFPEDAATVRQLLRNLLNMLHSRRVEHRGRFVAFNLDHYQEHLRRETLKVALGNSLEAQEFRLVYQPKVESTSGRFTGFEALARWTSSDLGPVPPSEFIPLAEQTGQIADLTRQLLDQSFAFLAKLEAAGHPSSSVAVNFSPGVFIPEFLDQVIDLLQSNGLGPRFDIEITEGVLMHLSGPLHTRFSRLKALGVTFSIDDFGTGYSNLGYLQNLEADTLKIDKRFIDGIPADEKNAKLVTAIIQMAQSLGMSVVAEGVEYQEQRDFLASAGCDQIQGYYFSKPLEAEAALAYLEKNGAGQ